MVNIHQGEGSRCILIIFAKCLKEEVMDQELLRQRLNEVIASGLVAKAISKRTDISTEILSRFKNGHVCLCEKDKDRLEAYLSKVVLPD